ncbi:Major facilitator superfamily [Neofusicoccum parvum]|nr:Major facilitator superfamily [Neofusicoccum parvum]
MSAIQEFTFSDVSKHNTKDDLYIVVNDKVYSCSSFLQEHPGGEEVLLGIAGQDASDAFKDIGHSDEAHENLNNLLVGTLKRQPGDIVQSSWEPSKSVDARYVTDSGISVYTALLIGGGLMFLAYYSL